MDVGTTNGWRLDDVVPSAELVATVGASIPLEPLAPNYPGEVADRWRYADGTGEVGVIASVSEPFCGSCTRARLSADGKLYTCLFAASGHDLRDRLRAGDTDEALRAFISSVWSVRADRYSELRTAATGDRRKIEMFAIGGWGIGWLPVRPPIHESWIRGVGGIVSAASAARGSASPGCRWRGRVRAVVVLGLVSWRGGALSLWPGPTTEAGGTAPSVDPA
jgi:hypothetical protein